MASDDKTESEFPARSESPGEGKKGDEYTDRIRDRIRDMAGIHDDSSVNDQEEADHPWEDVSSEQPKAPGFSGTPSWAELTKDERPTPEPKVLQASDRAKRRARDAQAERRALGFGTLAFVIVAGLILIGVNTMMRDDSRPRARPPRSKPPVVVAPQSSSPGPDAPPDIPALRHLESSGLTISAAGLPEVISKEGELGVSKEAGLETCRFAYAVWEFSPNRRFRFLSTCPAFVGQALVGAYEVNGETVKLSPLVVNGVRIVSDFKISNPPSMQSKVVHKSKKRVVELTVRQRVTSLAPGLAGDRVRDTLKTRNTLRPR